MIDRQWTVGDVYRSIDGLAPFDTAVPGDNVGLLIGGMERPADTVLTALDVTPGVVREARALGAQLVVAHHPLMFSPIQRLDEADPEAALIASLIRADISMIAAHTNLDMAHGGVNDALVAQLGWTADKSGVFLRSGPLAPGMTLGDSQAIVASQLDTTVLRYGDAGKAVRRFALCSGAGGSEVASAAAMGADVLLTGEIKHNQVLDALARGMGILACGHRATEICAADVLCRHLQSDANALELKVRVFVSKVDPFA